MLGSVGGNLIANRIEAWRNRSEEDVAAELGKKAQDDPNWREALDTLLKEFEAPQFVQTALSEEDRKWFARALGDELSKLGNLAKFEACLQGGGALAQGPGALAVHGDIGGDVLGAGAEKHVHIHGSPTTDPTTLRTAYLNRLFEQAGTLSLAGVDPKAASEAEARLNLGAVYTALLTLTPEAHESQERMLRGERSDREARRLSAVEQLNRHHRLVLLGDPGSGKSTFVNFVAMCLAGEALERPQVNLALLTSPLPTDEEEDKGQETPQPWRYGPLLPVRVVLRDFAARGLPFSGERATADHLWCFIVAELKSASLADYAPHLRYELLHRGGLVLLDGLDEVPEAERRRTQIKEVVEDFAASFGLCRILVTSRTYAYQKQDWRLSKFEVTVLAPFSSGQIRRFVDRWYAHIGELRHLDPADAQGRAEILKRAIFSGDRLRALAERPLLLTLMASIHAWRGGSLPEKREELYADAVELLLDWWESQRVVRDAKGNVVMIQPSLAEWLKVDRAKVRDLLNQLAYEGHAGQPDLVGTADVPEEKLVAGFMHISQNPDVKTKRLVEYLSQRAGLLLSRGVGVYTFPHRTFQEYLAACHLTDNDYPDLLADLARKDPGRWREVALLVGAKTTRGAASAIWSLVDALCFREPNDTGRSVADTWGAHLAGQALVEAANLERVGERNRRKLELVKRGLVHVMRGGDLPALERAQAGRVLAKLGDPRPEVTTVEGMEFCLVPGGPFWMGDGEERHLSEAAPYDYWIARYPVTNAQYQWFIRAGGYGEGRFWAEAKQEGYWKDGLFKGHFDKKGRGGPNEFGEPFDLPNHPAVGVTWYEALAFTRWLTGHLREAGLLPKGWAIRLPNEPEWEKAARGGLKIPARPVILTLGVGLTTASQHRSLEVESNPLPERTYPWGDEVDANRANYYETGVGTTNAVGCFPSGRSRYGVEELSGNVWEWTRSLYGSYPYPVAEEGREVRENLGATETESRVLRGGSFNYDDQSVRCADRLRLVRALRFNYIGFRLVASLSTSGL